MEQHSLASYEDAVRFHGHSCPGLALGYRMAIEAAAFLNMTRSADEECAGISECGFCGVDALQIVTGCTLGKGNLRVNDIGKRAFILFDRARNRACRATPSTKHEQARQRFLESGSTSRPGWTEHTLTEEGIISIVEVPPPSFNKAFIESSEPCSVCGELTMESRLAADAETGKKVCAVCRSGISY